jgi:hypothetical protein
VRFSTRRGLVRLLPIMLLVSAVSAAQTPEEEFPGALYRRPKPNLPPKKKTAPMPARPPVAPEPTPKPPTCVLGLEVVQTFKADGLSLEGFVLNLTARRLTFSLLNTCPQPPLQFVGLPSGVSAFETCAMGPCVKRDPVKVTLGPKERRRLAVGFAPWDGNVCSTPLHVDDFPIRGVVQFVGGGVTTCELPGTTRTDGVVPKPVPSTCPPPEPCGVYCPYGQAKDPSGCSSCACNPNPMQLKR